MTKAERRQWQETLTGLSTGAAREAIDRMRGVLDRLAGLVDRLPPPRASAIAAELLPPTERLAGVADYLEQVAALEAGQTVAAGTEAVPLP
jgi:hypothetical protein